MSRLGSALLGSNEYARPLICPPMEKTSGKPTRLERVCNNQRCGRSGTALAILCTHAHWLHIALVNPAGSLSRLSLIHI